MIENPRIKFETYLYIHIWGIRSRSILRALITRTMLTHLLHILEVKVSCPVSYVCYVELQGWVPGRLPLYAWVLMNREFLKGIFTHVAGLGSGSIGFKTFKLHGSVFIKFTTFKLHWSRFIGITTFKLHWSRFIGFTTFKLHGSKLVVSKTFSMDPDSLHAKH